MPSDRSPTQFVLAIDLPCEPTAASAALAGRLSRLITDCGVKSLWCGNRPKSLAKFAKLGGEVALRIDHLSNEGQSASETGRQVIQLLAECASAELSVSGAVIRADQTNLLETLARRGVRYVRLSPNSVRLPFFAPQPLSGGIWQMPVAMHLPLPSRWFPGQPAKRTLRGARAERELVVAAIDVAGLAHSTSPAWRQLEAFLPYLQKLRLRGEIQFASLAQMADRLAANKFAVPAHSILRAA